MGKEIVYCGGCGKSLREDDFAKGKANTIDNRPFCTACKPIVENRSSQSQTSARMAALKSSSSRSIPAAPSSTRRRRADEGSESSKAPLLIGASLVVAAILILIIYFASSSNRSPDVATPDPTPPPPTPLKTTRAPAPPPPGEPDRAAAAFKELETFAATSPRPVALLQRCDETRAAVQGTPFEARLKALEERARETHKSHQVEASLEEVKKLRALDSGYDRKEEILRLLNATLPIAGSRRAEVEEIIRKYGMDAQAYAARPPAPPPPLLPAGQASPPPLPPVPVPIVENSGAYDLDPQGGINHWLVLGPFANRNHPQSLYEQDLLRTEYNHVPAAGLDVTTRESTPLRWIPVVASEGKLLFRKTEGHGPSWKSEAPAIAFAACWIAADKDMEVKFRINAEKGYYLIMDGQRIMNRPGGRPFSEPEELNNIKLSQGSHLVMFKVAATDGLFGVRLRLSTVGSDRIAPGIKIWNQPPVTRKVLFAESFNEGPGRFLQGQVVDGGISGTKAFAIPQKGAWIDNPFPKPVTPQMTVRFKLKPLFEARHVEAMMWSDKLNVNAWYHIRNLKKGEWNVVEFKVVEARGGYMMTGASVEGLVPANLRITFDDQVPEGILLLDDFEVLE